MVQMTLFYGQEINDADFIEETIGHGGKRGWGRIRGLGLSYIHDRV